MGNVFIEDDCDRGATSVEKIKQIFSSCSVTKITYPCNGGAPCFPTIISGNLS